MKGESALTHHRVSRNIRACVGGGGVTNPEYKTDPPQEPLLTLSVDASPLARTVSGDQQLAAPMAVKPAV